MSAPPATAPDLALTDDERFPLLAAADRSLLARLREHPAAPRFTMRCGDRLNADGLRKVAAFERELFATEGRWQRGELPEWVRGFAARCIATVPFYRSLHPAGTPFEELASVTRADVQREPWSFVPDGEPLDDLINYYTSGTTGQRMDVLSHPATASMRLPLFRKALAPHGLTLDGGAGRVAILFVCSQSATFTYATLSSFLGGAASVKINLNPADWNHAGDRVGFIDDLDPELVTGDPASFLHLAELPVRIRPKAFVSSATALLPAVHETIEARFGCPVLDLYSSCETGPIGVSSGDGFAILPHDLYVEILRPDGSIADEGERGEIAVTGGRNPFLPLLRYRTGDWAALSFANGAPMLTRFEGRAPVVFRGADGRRVQNLDITIALRAFPLARYAVHQRGDGSLLVRVDGSPDVPALRAAFETLFGRGQHVDVEPLPRGGGKLVTYRSDTLLEAPAQ
jgi:phenylacetate-CoA ligase